MIFSERFGRQRRTEARSLARRLAKADYKGNFEAEY
jgi:hypothetical protein